MFALELETEFSAAHAIEIAGERERVHGHNFRVRATIAGPSLDRDGLLCDFHLVERWLAQIIAPFRDSDLNMTPPFDRINPTAERIAEHIAIELGRMFSLNPRGLRVESVRVTEAAGCAAVYRATAV
ncbi:MAG: 6-carboxytetrahydropterin synthase [Phycisphaerae bacterium]|nr:6-carboxytetrahydropterin synthase [Phycisphaerae bacterium]